MALAKMGVNHFHLYDEDGVTDVNLPNQMYAPDQIRMFKSDALYDLIKRFNPDINGYFSHKNYTHQPLNPIVFVCTDSMVSRKLVFKQFANQPQCLYYIEARMGAEEGQVYTINKKPKWHPHFNPTTELVVSKEDVIFYMERLYTDLEAKEAPCTAKAIIYNVFMIAALVCRSFTSIIREETEYPREVVFGMAQIHKYSFQVRK
jgi:hypothetical protein